MKSFFPRLGGKSNIANKIVKHIPHHQIYIEPFVGAGSVFLRKPVSNEEIINDIDPDIYHIWTDMKSIGECIDDMDFYIDEDQFNEYKHRESFDTKKERLHRNLCLSFSSFVALREKYHDRPKYRSNRPYIKNNCRKIKDRLQNVTMKSKDFREIINEYDDEYDDVFFYFDPPYFGSGRGYKFGNELTPQDIFDAVKNMRNRFMISYWDEQKHYMVRDTFKDYFIEDIEVYHSSRHRFQSELLITNYEPDALKEIAASN